MADTKTREWGTNRVFYEAQIGEYDDGGWWMTLCMTTGTSTWTSRPIRLEATDKQGAHAEAAANVKHLAAILTPS